MDGGTTNAETLDWTLARGMIEEFLPRSRWQEEVLAIEKGEPGQLEVRAQDARRRFWFPGCGVRVRRMADGREIDRRYSFVFDWREGRWQKVDLPAVGA
jgi:hypothetical protein